MSNVQIFHGQECANAKLNFYSHFTVGKEIQKLVFQSYYALSLKIQMGLDVLQSLVIFLLRCIILQICSAYSL